MSQTKFSSRSTNLDIAHSVTAGDSDASIPAYIEIPYSYFLSVAPPSQDTLREVAYNTSFHEPPKQIVEHYFTKLALHGLFSDLDRQIEHITERGPVIVRCAPVTPERPELSFAGTYPSFVPKPFPQTKEAIHTAIAAVLAGKHTRYADYYNARHNIAHRKLGIIVMELVDKPAIHGTAYCYEGNVRSEHVFDPSLDNEQTGALHFVQDKFGETGSAQNNPFCADINFVSRLTDFCRKLERTFSKPLDLEYLVDDAGVINLVQIREISEKHKLNWRKYYGQNSDDVLLNDEVERRAIISSVGMIEGQIENLQPASSFVTSPNKITTIFHDNSSTLLESLNKQRHEDHLQLIVTHGEERVRDHLQYSMLEDPSVKFLYHAKLGELTAEPGEYVRLFSNGDIVRRVGH